MKIDFDKMTRNFILNEGTSPGVIAYIQALAEMLNSISPRSVTDSRRLEVAKENLLNIRRHVKRLEEKVNFLEEEMKILQEKQIASTDKE